MENYLNAERVIKLIKEYAAIMVGSEYSKIRFCSGVNIVWSINYEI